MEDVYCLYCKKELQNFNSTVYGDYKRIDRMCITDVDECHDRYFDRYSCLAGTNMFDSVKLLWEVNHLKR
jgi:hypothetical protein